MTLGQTIGTVRHTFSNTNSTGDKAQITAVIDYSTASNVEIVEWLNSNRVIRYAVPLNALSGAEMKARSGVTVIAQNIGRKIRSRDEQIQEHLAAGFTQAMAEVAVDNPQLYAKVMAKMDEELELAKMEGAEEPEIEHSYSDKAGTELDSE